MTRSLDTPIPGIKDLIAENKERIRKGMVAYAMLEKIRGGDQTEATRQKFDQHRDDLGFGLLLKKFTPKVIDATEAQIQQAANDTIPRVSWMFWSFRIMVGLGFYFLALIGLAFYYCAWRVFDQKRWLLKWLLYSLPLPWIAIWAGWFVAEYGRQPWTIGEVLPTFVSVSSLTIGDLIGSLIGLIALYTVFLIAEVYLMLKFIRIGPSSLYTGRYHFEQETVPESAG
jgi:cytochrome d ubiquinol oxidase subunit I